jgi:multidrug efflux pump subunit AcrB
MHSGYYMHNLLILKEPPHFAHAVCSWFERHFGEKTTCFHKKEENIWAYVITMVFLSALVFCFGTSWTIFTKLGMNFIPREDISVFYFVISPSQ